VVIMERDDDGC